MYTVRSADNVEHLIALLKEGKDALKTPIMDTANVSIDYLEGVAKLRYVCSSVTEMLYQQSRNPDVMHTALEQLLQPMQSLCENDNLNTECSGPGIFLMKQIARQRGMSCLAKLKAKEGLDWIIPAHLRRTDEVGCIDVESENRAVTLYIYF